MIPTWTEKGKGQYKNKNDKSSQPTEQEWVQYYKIIGDEQHGDFVYHTETNERYVRLESKIVIDDNDFVSPKVKEVIAFDNNDLLNDALNQIARRGIIK